MKIWEKSVCLALILSILASFTTLSAECSGIQSRVLRLHVLANSDSQSDQAIKLKVRDRILTESTGMLDGVKTRDEAEQRVASHLPEIQKTAEDELRSLGSSNSVHAELTNMYFSTRQYGNITLPAGKYDALRITIGSGKGHNWWCVLFPALCLPAAEAPSRLEDVLSSSEMQLVQGKNNNNNGVNYEVKFRSVELFEEFRDWLSHQFNF
jgi:stage II sporulation protein R